jgi:polysaccharide biosynthesis protein PslE
VTPIVSLPSFREVLSVAFYFKWRMLLAFLLPVAVSLALALMSQPQYRADSKMLVRAGREYMPQSEVPGSGQALPQSTMQETIDTEVEILTGHDLIQGVLHKIGLARLYPRLARSPIPGRSLEEAAETQLKRDLIVTPVKLSNVIAISLLNPNRQMAIEALKLILSSFEERHIAAFSLDRTSVLKMQLASDLKKLLFLEVERAKYQNKHKLFASDEERSVLIQQRSRNINELIEAEAERQMLTKKLEYLQQQLGREPETVVLSTADDNAKATETAAERVQALREKEEQLRAVFAPGSPMLAPTAAALAVAERSLSRLKARATPATTGQSVTVGPNHLFLTLKSQVYAAQASLAPLTSQIAFLKQVVGDTTQDLVDLTNRGTELLDLNRQVAELTSATNTLRQRLADARYLEDLDQARIASLDVIEKPAATSKPVSPKKSLYLAAGVVLGGALAIFVLLLALTFGNRFLMLETVERFLAVPVVTALPAISPRELRHYPRTDPTVSEPAPRARTVL